METKSSVVEVNSSTTFIQNPYDLALSFMPALLFIAAVLTVIKGWGWMRDRTAKDIQKTANIESRLDDLEKSSQAIARQDEKLNNHETRLTIIETNNAHINTTLGELKSDIKQLNDNVMKIVAPRKGA